MNKSIIIKHAEKGLVTVIRDKEEHYYIRQENFDNCQSKIIIVNFKSQYLQKPPKRLILFWRNYWKMLASHSNNMIILSLLKISKSERKNTSFLKWGALSFKLSVLKKIHLWTIIPWPGYSLGRDWAVWVIRTTK